MTRYIVPITLLHRVEHFMKSLYTAITRTNTRPIVLSMSMGHTMYCCRRKRLAFSDPDRMKFAVPLTSFVLE